ncbi:L-lactate dehydrogenase [Hyphococcus luteus]|uniref:Alpha-hydroxy-acid oxidizing enzyme n=1 Tax=Hyphococcus luteus TaxID=2058213 RepID=A0A2S7KA45_9PROT|nr:L-lactate dehydrogenase [Marinicaulis flavus]PQA89351.1 alpha-hydroxy-acid oxidizing enzyme [Marinicaulis flavus]
MPSLRLAPASTSDFRNLAERRLPRQLFDYVDGGAYGENTLRANVDDFQKLRLRQRVMRDVSKLDTSVDLFGTQLAMPLALAPVGLGGMMARRAEVQAKRAADARAVPFCLSTVALCPVDEVAAVSPTPFWFQLYMLRDRGAVKEILDRAKAAGVKTLVFTVDVAILGTRYRDIRNGLSGEVSGWGKLRSGPLSYLLHPDWTYDVGVKGKPHTFGNLEKYVPDAKTPADFAAWITSQIDASVTWKDIEWLRSVWEGDLVIKGVLTPEDAQEAVNAGADGVIVSNHGGRQLDGVSSSIEALPRIAEAVGDRTAVLMDGGVRSGLDVVKAVASGARAVLIGRPWIYALAARGEPGLVAILKNFEAEMKVAMSLTGARHVGEITREILDVSSRD